MIEPVLKREMSNVSNSLWHASQSQHPRRFIGNGSHKHRTLCPEVEKSIFFMFSKTSLNTYFQKVHRFFGFFNNNKNLLQNLHPFWFSVVLNIAFLRQTKVCMENCRFWPFWVFLFVFFNMFYFKQNSIIQYNHIKYSTSF